MLNAVRKALCMQPYAFSVIEQHVFSALTYLRAT